MMNLKDIVDREEIRHLTACWTDAVNRRDYEAFRGLWTEDAVWTIGQPLPMQVAGADSIVAKLQELLTLDKAFFQALHQGVIEINQDEAAARWGVTEFGKPPNPDQGYFNHAFYRDQLVKTPAGWRFARRDYQYIYVDSSLLRGEWYSPV